ncbi:MAG: phytanoyl-CoA dioxygenase family protein [Rudaea sp.]|nr:phytanoyl-CoA dioxygenase family protein [Rudaea sp.]
MLVDSMGVGLEQLARFLTTSPSFAALQSFILDCNGGSIAPARIAWINALQNGGAYAPEVLRRHADIGAMAPVFSAADMAHWSEHGYVVLPQAISRQECAAAFAAVHACIGADPDDPRTWYGRDHRQGIMVQMFQHPALQAARESLRIHKGFAQLWNCVDLLMTTDRCGFNPPECDLFRFPGPHLHWDALLEPPIPLGIQGIMYLADTPADQGAFSCVPGFHRRIDEWLRNLPHDVDPHTQIPADAVRPIAGKAGDLILWHHALPHSSRPNHGVRPRVVQYLTMYPVRQ